MKSMIGEPRVVEAGRGAAWWGTGWRLFTSNFWTWIGIMIIYIIITVLISLVPYVGDVGHWLLTPVFMGGLMLGCAAIERNEPLRVAHLFEGFQGAHFVPLMIIGAVNIALSLGIGALAVAGVMGGMRLADLANIGAIGDPFEAFLGSARAMTGTGLLTMLLILVIAAVFAMLNWFAPALVALRGATAFEAMKLSFMSSLRNWAPFLVYGAIGIGIVVAAFMLFGGLALLLGAGALMGGSNNGWGAVLGLVVLFFVLAMIAALLVWPVVFGTTYAGYKDTLGVADAEIGNPAYR